MKRKRLRKSKKRIFFIPCDKKGIPLKEVIAVHRQFRSSRALSGNLGDGFLYAMNPIFRNVRNEFLKRGFSFTEENICHYFSFPLMSLDDVIAARAVPYRDNFSWLGVLEKRAPGKFTLSELKRSELQFNYLFHESAHFIAHSVFFGRIHPAAVPKNSDSLLKILLGESFANTVECLSSAFAEGEMGAYFLDANCHFRSNEKEVTVIRESLKKIGVEGVARILLAAFLYSNFMYEILGRKEKKLIFEFSGIQKKTSIEALIRIGLQLSVQFRSTTTHLHLLKIGYEADLAKLMRFDPVARLLKKENSSLKEKAEFLAAVIGRVP